MKKKPSFLFNFLSKIIIYAIVFSYSCLHLQAQDGYVPGFIVSTKNDTLTGLIKEELKPTGFILHYKNSENTKVKEYAVKAVNEYYYSKTNELFERNFITKNGIQKEVFFRCHVKGTINFYSYVDDSFYKFFYIKGKDGLLRELKIEEKEEWSEAKQERIRQTKNLYIGELNFALKDCSGIGSKIEGLPLAASNITKLMINYHECVDKPYVSFGGRKDLGKRKVEIGLLYRGFSGKLSDTRTDEDYTLKSSLSPYVVFYLRKSKNRWGIELRYAYLTVKNKFGAEVSIHEVPIRLNRYFKMKNHRLATKVGIDFYPNSNLGAGFRAGVGYDYSIKKFRIVSSVDFYLFNFTGASYNLGAGYQF